MLQGMIGCTRHVPTVEPVSEFVATVSQLSLMTDTLARRRAASEFALTLLGAQRTIEQDSTALLWYHGSAQRVCVAGDFNGWNPDSSAMQPIAHTDFFWMSLLLDPASRVEYKFVVDGRWMLDPANPQKARGGFGENSELRMPGYHAPDFIRPQPGLPEGHLDTLRFRSAMLGRPVQVYVYTPPPSVHVEGPLPSLTVADGSDYLFFGDMKVVLDNLIAQRRIRPLIGVFLEPRGDPQDDGTNSRMVDYILDDHYRSFLTGELRDTLMRHYPLSTQPDETGIMGASLGGLLATYVALSPPAIYSLCAAQSPAYRIAEDSVFSMASSSATLPHRVYLQAGTLGDTQAETMQMAALLSARGAHVRYLEIPEGHNWGNWQAHLDELLSFLYGPTP